MSAQEHKEDMKQFTIWLKQPKVTIFIGGDPLKGQAPILTATIDNPQILVDREKNTITIVESK